MSRWRPQLFEADAAEKARSVEVTQRAIATAQLIAKANPDIAPIFTLKHLAFVSGVEYNFLRSIVSRSMASPYQLFRIRKRLLKYEMERFRIIAVAHPELAKVQRWIVQEILAKARPHFASVAFSKGDTLHDAAKPHCGSKWIIKFDVRDFFESITEVSVYRVFRSLGYQALVAFELTRICTRLRTSGHPVGKKWHVKRDRWDRISAYQVLEGFNRFKMGSLPQGAPTSPMLANLAMKQFDEIVAELATKHGMIYTRYADDLTLSARIGSRVGFDQVIARVYDAMKRYGLSPNRTKTKILSPGARKVVLGVLVDGRDPKLTREFRASLRQHLYYLSHPNVGPVLHARRRGFSSVTGLKNHLFGLAGYAAQIEPTYGQKIISELKKVQWPF